MPQSAQNISMLPDNGPLITLAYADALNVLLKHGATAMQNFMLMLRLQNLLNVVDRPTRLTPPCRHKHCAVQPTVLG